MSQQNRIDGGQIDRNQTHKFSWNGMWLSGHPGDTLASALLANGHRLVGRSFKYHRPRGVFSAGSEEPNALVQLRTGAAQEPNTKATTVELFDGLQATSQNHRGPLEWDLMAANDLLSPFLSAGFYYKTFMWPKSFWEKVYEPFIRASAGLGRLSMEADPDCYDHGFLHCDLLIIGAGPAGLAAALAAGRAGARVILADEDFRMGGRLNSETYEVADQPGDNWAAASVAELSTMPNVRLMTRTTVYGAYDHGIYGALERKTDHLADSGGKPRQVLWRIYSQRSLLTAGATERSIAFGNNDRPGVMLAGAVRSYVNRFGVAPGRKVAVFTNNDDGLRTADDLRAKGIEIAQVIDARAGDVVINTAGRKGIRRILLNNNKWIEADWLAVSGGWSPNVALTCHHRGRPTWRDDIAGFVPGGDLPPGMTVAGAANGSITLSGAINEAHA
ncbi:MAG: 2Fe-2S iron-sulfur cluster-binding protein, partial [Boseongicola sp.]